MRKVEQEILQPQGFGSIQNSGLPIGPTGVLEIFTKYLPNIPIY